MKIAYISTFDPSDRNRWSGLIYSIAQSLVSAGCELEYIAPLNERFKVLFRGADFFSRKLLKRALQRDREPIILDSYARQVEAALAKINVDFVFSPGAIPVSRLKSSKPLAVWTDATYAAYRAYKWEIQPLPRSYRLGMDMDRRIGKLADLSIFSSDWAARSAIEDGGTDPTRVHVVPFGANLEDAPPTSRFEQELGRRQLDTLRLLYVGTSWARKGGDVAIEAARQLHESGVPVQLTMLGGDIPDQSTLPPFVKRQPFISKATAEGRAQISRIFSESHFLIHPALAEAYGLVLCEAAAWGLPCLASRVGGIPTIVKEGVNGFLFEPGDASSIAQQATKLFRDPAAYFALAKSSRQRFDDELNWGVAGKRVLALMEDVLRKRSST